MLGSSSKLGTRTTGQGLENFNNCVNGGAECRRSDPSMATMRTQKRRFWWSKRGIPKRQNSCSKGLTYRSLRLGRATLGQPSATKTLSVSTWNKKSKNGAPNSRHLLTSRGLNLKLPTLPLSLVSAENGTSCKEQFRTARISSNRSKN